MPRIELIPVPLYNPNDPYHWQFDNLPLQNLMRRQNLINLALDDLLVQTRDAIGTQGSLANRLNQSIDQDGSLKSTAIDDAMHGIGSHADDSWGNQEEFDAWSANRSAPFVRMEKAESDKLANMADNATNFYLQIQLPNDDIVSMDSGNLILMPSTSVEWEVESPNKLKAHLGFPLESAHRHYYDQIPAHEDQGDPDYKNYKANTISTPYVEGSLRVYVNGMRLSSSSEIYVQGSIVNNPYTSLSYSTDSENGTFTLSSNLSEDDVIRIDYDISFVE